MRIQESIQDYTTTGLQYYMNTQIIKIILIFIFEQKNLKILQVHFALFISVQILSDLFRSIEIHSDPFRSIQIRSDPFRYIQTNSYSL